MLSDEASKLHKSLDLTIYFDYLRQLFAQTTSDSDSSDSDEDVIKHEELDPPPSLSNPTPTSTPPNFPNDTSPSSSSKSNYNFTPSSGNSNGDEESSSARTTKSSSSGNSLTSSENSEDEEDDCSDLDLTPISDLELNNIFFDHKLWKKSPEPGQDFLIIPPDIKKEKRDVFSDGGGPSSKSQSLLSKDRHGRHSLQNIKLKYSVAPSTSRASLINDLKLGIHPKIGNCLEHSEGVLDNGGVGVAQAGSSHILMGSGECGEDDEDCQDDNDSLSDYMNMTANSALVLDPYFKYESDCMTPNPVPPIPNVFSKIHINDIRKQHKHMIKSGGSSHHHHSSKHKKMSEQKKTKSIESMNLKRRRLYILLCKKEIGKAQRARVTNHKEMLIAQRRLALACNRHFRKKAIQSQKAMKESIWRAKRHSREMQAYWKQTDRVDREVRKRREKESDEHKKLDMMEAKIQQRKFDFLITQIELYANFITKSVRDSNPFIREESVILSQLIEESKKGPEDCDTEEIKNKAIRKVENACKMQMERLQAYNLDCEIKGEPNVDGKEMSKFHGDLTQYQLKTLKWLVSRFDQGINCILADESESGKTVQSIGYLSRVTEIYGIWGPFLIIAPTSTLHNWQQEFNRIRPDFKVVPYWGNPQERTMLREVWQLTESHNENTLFHVVVTSYQIILTDLKYFKQINWQCIILDEAEPIKSISSEKWRLLSGFNTRNRLLLTGAQFRNTIEELWALLHFAMPPLFDSHDEFNDGFMKYRESQVENKSLPDENNLSRVLTILKSFMWRRSENDVEHRHLDKMEVVLHCPLTRTQRSRYRVVKKKVRVDDLLKISGPMNSQLVQPTTTNLLNLITRFRKVCNHPGLFDRRHILSPFFMPLLNTFPKLSIEDSNFTLQSKLELVHTDLSIYNPAEMNDSLVSGKPATDCVDSVIVDSAWSFLRFIGLSISELNKIVHGGPLTKWKFILDEYRKLEVIYRQRQWSDTTLKPRFTGSNDFLLDINPPLSFVNQQDSIIMRDLVFVVPSSSVYTFLQERISSIPETIEHRKLRCRKLRLTSAEDLKGPTPLEECVHTPKEYFREVCPTEMPSFLSNICPAKVRCGIAPIRPLKNQVSYSEELLSRPPVTVSLLNEIECFPSFHPQNGWSQLIIPDKDKLVTDSGKLQILDNLLRRLNSERHRVIIFSQMAKMIDLLEEYISYRKWAYMRLDGPSKISDRRYNVSEFQSTSDIFVYLIITRTGSSIAGVPDADTVIFYDSDWNSANEQQALDRAFQTSKIKQVTVYRLISKDTIEERVLQMAKQKSESQKLTVRGKNFRPETLKPAEIVFLLLDDDEIERKYLQKQAEGKSGQFDSASTENTDQSSPSTSATKRKSVLNSEKVPISSSKEIDSILKRSKVQDDSAETAPELGLMTLVGNECSSTDSPSQEMYFDEIGTEMTDEIYSSNDDDCMEGSDLDEFCGDDYDTVDGGPCTKSQSNTESVSSDLDDDFGGLISRRRLGRGSGKRGRPPLRVRTVTRDIDGDSPFRRGPGRPRIKPIGPANQGIRGRGPGRPPLSRKPETLTSSLPLTTSQKVFGFYSSLDLDPT